jgi:stage II sporulation protein D
VRSPALSRRAALALLASSVLLATGPSLARAADPPRLPERVPVRMPDGTTVDLAFEEYLKGVVPTEMPATWPEEALKAQAVAARSYAAAYLATRGAICTTTNCQAWHPARRSARADAAVDATRGQVLLHDGALAWTFFSSTCGGQTASGSGRAARYCRSVRCWLETDGSSAALDLRAESAASAFWARSERPAAFCARSPRFRHAITIDRAATEAAVERFLPAIATAAPRYKAGALGELREVIALERNGSGRIARMRLAGSGGSWDVTGESAIRSILRAAPTGDPQLSTALVLEPARSGDALSGLRVRGGGYGHGIGLCQHGARGMAERGHAYQAILRHYYQAVELVTL